MGGLKLQGEVIATGLQFPEGPVALPDGSVLVVEIAGGRRLLDARRPVAGGLFLERRNDDRARRITRWMLAAWMKDAARWRSRRRGNVAC